MMRPGAYGHQWAAGMWPMWAPYDVRNAQAHRMHTVISVRGFRLFLLEGAGLLTTYCITQRDAHHESRRKKRARKTSTPKHREPPAAGAMPCGRARKTRYPPPAGRRKVGHSSNLGSNTRWGGVGAVRGETYGP